MNPIRADHKVLIIASDPLLGALVGSLVEATRLQAAFPRENERPEDALARVRPLAAILVDAITSESESDLFLARARRRRILVLMFGSADSVGQRAAWATARHVPMFAIPADVHALQAALERVLSPGKPSPRGTERRTAHTERAPNGTLIFDDGKGTRWSVYDRRAADRRQDVIDRSFVSDRGEVRHCDVPLADAESISVAELSRQLARATTVAE